MGEKYTVFLLDDAEQDLWGIYTYIGYQFSESLAREIYQEIRDQILLLEDNPNLGHKVPQLAALGMVNYRQMVVLGKNRIVYEIDKTRARIYVYLICNERQNYDAVLRNRILQY